MNEKKNADQKNADLTTVLLGAVSGDDESAELEVLTKGSGGYGTHDGFPEHGWDSFRV